MNLLKFRHSTTKEQKHYQELIITLNILGLILLGLVAYTMVSKTVTINMAIMMWNCFLMAITIFANSTQSVVLKLINGKKTAVVILGIITIAMFCNIIFNVFICF